MWRVTLFGGLRAELGERRLTSFRTHKTASLFAWLAVAERKQPRDALIEMFWPEGDLAAGRNSLSVALSWLRAELRDELEPVVLATRTTVRLNPRRVVCDLAEVRAALRVAMVAETAEQRLGCLHRALDLAAAPLLEGYDDEWVDRERAELLRSYLTAQALAVRDLEDGGRIEEALELVRRGLVLAPLDEPTQELLVWLPARVGRPQEGLAAFSAYTRALAEIAAEPSPRLRELAAAIETGEPTPAPAAPRGGTLSFVAARCPAVSPRTLADSLPPGSRFRVTADHLLAAFDRASEALSWLIDRQQAHGELTGALHTAEVTVAGELDDSPAGAHAAGLLDAGHPGQLLATEPAAVLLRAETRPGVWSRELGLYRLPTGREPERLYQLHHADQTRRQFPPPRAVAGYASRLPSRLTRFFGREGELRRLEDELLGDRSRLVTLTGPGGSGKSRLALETAWRLLDSYAGAVWFCALAEVYAPEQFTDRLREMLDLPRLAGAEPWATVIETLRRQRALLVLDNIEPTNDGFGELLRDLIARCGELQILATSHGRLGLTGERELPVPPLPVPIDAADQCASKLLFVDRARAVRSSFRPVGADLRRVTEICRRLDGMPLAIELAAALLEGLSLRDLTERLDERLDLLTSDASDVLARHRSLRAAISSSWDLLPEAHRRTAAWLSVFRDGFTVEAAGVVCSAERPLTVVRQLRQAALVVPDDAIAGRFRQLETVRLYGLEQLTAAGEVEAARERHARYFARLAQGVGERLEELDDDGLLDAMEADAANPDDAGEWLLERDVAAAADLAVGRWRPAVVRGRIEPLRRSHRRLIDALADTEPARRARLLAQLAATEYMVSDYAAAEATAVEALALAQSIGDRRVEGYARAELGRVGWARGDHETARREFDAALHLRRELGDQRAIAGALSGLAAVWLATGAAADARQLVSESLELRRAAGDRRGTAASLTTLGRLAYGSGAYDHARAALAEALEVWRELRDRAGAAQTLHSLSQIALATGDLDEAERLQAEALEHSRAIGDRRLAATVLSDQALSASHRGQLDRARSHAESSLALRRELGDRRGVEVSLQALGEVELKAGQLAVAREHLEAALAEATAVGHVDGIARCHVVLCMVALEDHDPARARAHAEAGIECTSPGLAMIAAYARNFLAEACLRLGDLPAARDACRAGLERFRAVADRTGQRQALAAWVRICHAAGESMRAARAHGAAEELRRAMGMELSIAETDEWADIAAELRESLGEETCAVALAEGSADPAAVMRDVLRT